ncbi:hypothetical protein M3P36_02140 [Altererythrobacter sp. KTW20L]|uniref:hypothetical protein n=1 Tax=Altererythrobacter sp. KTW20L TaxID=2942210 RepID=UPI0020BFAD19|nr:hypothetical protein [Altererythrobacter sp. KTW20L]MCL6249850.1 hypothetical protein [Altererythrobacter sp. KTW20L]
MSAQCWRTLGIKATDDKAAIRRAYADKLKALDVDNDVAGFAKLRQARDIALRLAASAAARAAEEQAPEEPDYRDDGADYGSPDDWDAVVLESDQAPAEPPVPGARTRAWGSEEPPETDSQRIERQLRALAQLVFPDGNYSDDGFTLPDYEQALALVNSLVAEAHAARLEVYNAIDHHLAEMMAQGWPRSAALVERANEEFHWLGEAGTIDERPALRFLNLRIRGMRFVENVGQPGHVLHKVWTELARPGKPNPLDRFRAKKDDVRILLNGVRERYPEVESYLNPERVGWWDRRLTDSGPGIIGWIIRIVGILWMVAVVFGALSRGDNNERNARTQVESAAENQAETPMSEREEELGLRLALEQIMGKDGAVEAGEDYSAFRAGVTTAYLSSRRSGENHEQALVRALQVARVFALDARRLAEFGELVEINEVQRLWLQALQREGRIGEDCPMRKAGLAGLGDVILGVEPQERERAMFRRLREAGLMASHPRFGELRADIPGDVVGAIIDRSGLADETVYAALQDNGHQRRCQVKLAMLDVVLARPGTVSADLLRIL